MVIDSTIGGQEFPLFDRPDYPPEGHGVLYQNKHQFEKRVAVDIPAGATRLAVTSINAKGGWAVALRLTDYDGYPLPDVTFRLAE